MERGRKKAGRKRARCAGTAKARTARGATNVKINVVSKNPITKKANTPKKRRLWKKIEKAEQKRIGKVRAIRAANAAIGRLKRNPPKRKRRARASAKAKTAYLICLRTATGAYYWAKGLSKGGLVTPERSKATRFKSLAAAKTKARALLKKAIPAVKTISVDRV